MRGRLHMHDVRLLRRQGDGRKHMQHGHRPCRQRYGDRRPFDERFASVWLPVTAAPYYILYAADLREIGYRRRDVLRGYALNLLLIPVSLGGVLRSIHQACTGRRSTFGRTPKVIGRTAAPAGYVLAEGGLFTWWTFGALLELEAGHLLNGLFALANAVFLSYALVRFVCLP